jgi:histone H3/H4
MAKAYVVTARVKELMKENDMRMSGDAMNAINWMIEEALRKAVKRARANGRKTLKPEDL